MTICLIMSNDKPLLEAVQDSPAFELRNIPLKTVAANKLLEFVGSIAISVIAPPQGPWVSQLLISMPGVRVSEGVGDGNQVGETFHEGKGEVDDEVTIRIEAGELGEKVKAQEPLMSKPTKAMRRGNLPAI
jgi:hypothetical protein